MAYPGTRPGREANDTGDKTAESKAAVEEPRDRTAAAAMLEFIVRLQRTGARATYTWNMANFLADEALSLPAKADSATVVGLRQPTGLLLPEPCFGVLGPAQIESGLGPTMAPNGFTKTELVAEAAD